MLITIRGKKDSDRPQRLAKLREEFENELILIKEETSGDLYIVCSQALWARVNAWGTYFGYIMLKTGILKVRMKVFDTGMEKNAIAQIAEGVYDIAIVPTNPSSYKLFMKRRVATFIPTGMFVILRDQGPQVSVFSFNGTLNSIKQKLATLCDVKIE